MNIFHNIVHLNLTTFHTCRPSVYHTDAVDNIVLHFTRTVHCTIYVHNSVNGQSRDHTCLARVTVV